MLPYDALTQEDKEIINEYIISYTSITPQDLKQTLSYWNDAKKKLFKAFGQQLRISVPISGQVDYNSRRNRLRSLYSPICAYSVFDLEHRTLDPQNHMLFFELRKWEVENEGHIDFHFYKALNLMFKYPYIEEGKLLSDFIFEGGRNNKPLKIPCGIKTMRAIRKVLEYYDFPRMDLFYNWRDEISVIDTDKQVDAELVFSIHPIDYMTMSDNRSGWTSCMSWVRNGAYSTGTLEMLNSNMAVVAYIKNPVKYEFNGHCLPNKSWRALMFTHKDILITGKNYPYQSELISKMALKELSKILYNGLGWKYQYKDQRYQDLIHYHENNFVRDSLYRNPHTHKIITYTGVMYHDMVEDNMTSYWCYRNWVKKSLYLSLSGKATCLCCGEPIAECPEYIDSTSDKYCGECQENFGCDCCGTISPSLTKRYRIVTRFYSWGQRREENVCEDCLLDSYEYDEETNTISPIITWHGEEKKIRKRISRGDIAKYEASGALSRL